MMKRWARNLAARAAARRSGGLRHDRQRPARSVRGLQPRDVLVQRRLRRGRSASRSRPPTATCCPARSAPGSAISSPTSRDLWIGVNNLLQGKPGDTVTDWARFAFNTTVRRCSASTMSPPTWGWRSTTRTSARPSAAGAWATAPTSSGRSSARARCATPLGLVLDVGTSTRWLRHNAACAWRYAAVATRAIGKRADLLDASRILEEAALDKYVFQRDAYLQRRRSLIYDGNPPRAAREAPQRSTEAVEPGAAVDAVPAVAAAPAPRRCAARCATSRSLPRPVRWKRRCGCSSSPPSPAASSGG